MTHATGNAEAHIPISIKADLSGLSAKDLRVLDLLIRATRIVNAIFLDQARQRRSGSQWIFDKSRGYDFYPHDATAKEIEEYLARFPQQRDELLSPFTVVERKGDRLVAVPYSQKYATRLKAVIRCLTAAAEETDNESFARFLKSKANAFETNQHRKSDIDWIRVGGSVLELTIGPYEDYCDSLFGVKRDFEALLGIVLAKETAEAMRFQEWISRFDAYLGSKYAYATSTTLTPMVVIDEVCAGGFPLYGYVPMAYNLPNDPDIQREVGSRKVFIRNVMEAKFARITQEVASKVLPETFGSIDPAILMRFVIGHESAHGLSFRFDGEYFRTLGSPLEEGKADVFGLLFLYYLADNRIIDYRVAESAVMQSLTDGIRQCRVGLDEPHALGKLVQYNWLVKNQALTFEREQLVFQPETLRSAIISLGDALYHLSKTRDHSAAQRFVHQWGLVPDEIRRMTATLNEIPIDIDPIFDM